jgi:hypothetical protein
MSEMAKTARAAMKDKAKRLTSGDPTQKVDSSTWSPSEPINADIKTGMRPISRRAFKSGGKVDGAKPSANMGKSVRSGNKPTTPDSMVNRNVKEANEDRAGIKHIGGMKKGGAAKAVGGPLAGAKKQMDASVMQAGVPDARFGFGGIRKGQISPARGLGIKTGGKVEKHDDVKADKALIKKMVRPSARTGKDEGGGTISVSPGKDYLRGDSNFERRMGALKASNRVGAQANAALKQNGEDRSPESWDKYSNLSKGSKMLYNAYADEDNKDKSSPPSMPNGALRKAGGRAKRKDGGGVFSGPGYPGKVPGVVPGGRTAHAKGGKTGTTVNIIMAGKPADDDMMAASMAGPTQPPIPVAVPPPAGAPAGGMPAGMPIPMPAPPAAGAPLARKAGGRTYRSYKDMDAGAGSGLGRLEKTEIQAHKK